MRPTIALRGKGPHRIWVTSCIHFGAEEHEARAWRAHFDRALAEGWRFVCLGDAFEMVGLRDKVASYGALWDQTKPPPDQLREALWFFRQLPFDAVCEGNHDWRFAVGHGISVWDDVVLPQVRSRTSPALYLGPGGFFRYTRPDGSELRLVASHGEGPVANPVTTLYRMMLAWPGADAYLAGHTHDVLVHPVRQEAFDGPHRQLCVRAGTYLGFARYAKARLLGKPTTAIGSVLLTWERDGSLHGEPLVA